MFVYFGLSTMKDNDNQSLCLLPEMRKLPGDFKSFVFFLPFVLIFFFHWHHNFYFHLLLLGFQRFAINGNFFVLYYIMKMS